MADDRADMDDEALAMARLDDVLAAVAARDAARVDTLLEPLHAADIADLLEQISPPTGPTCWRCGTAGSTAKCCPRSTRRSARR